MDTWTNQHTGSVCSKKQLSFSRFRIKDNENVRSHIPVMKVCLTPLMNILNSNNRPKAQTL
eukprot:snap_masked-scaffold_13-processed-gene-2.18-mRNA-1 protein AED:1.00 eAED:1.00 QI:0/0/0/0/1/1/2/0/60